MTLDVHHPSPADVDPLGEGLSARRCRQRASERDQRQQFHDDVFHGCSPFAFNSPARCPATHKLRLVIFYWARRTNKSTVKPRILTQFGGSSFVRFGSFASFRLCPMSGLPPTTTEWRTFENGRNVPFPDSCTAAKTGRDGLLALRLARWV